RPLTVFFGLLLGTCVSVMFSLASLALIWAVLSPSNPRLAAQIPHRLGWVAAFMLLTALTALSFIGQLRLRSWRRYAHLATLGALVALFVCWSAGR
ncbi:MAG TPA: hypothetical protein VMU86_01610, partial [Steroidobacteraceae bacterium]|nr:hypothetical protein [Steroidobacteraceae bacterium]